MDLVPFKELKTRLIDIMREDPQDLQCYATQIGLSLVTLHKIIYKKEYEPAFKTRMLLEKYIFQKEKEHTHE